MNDHLKVINAIEERFYEEGLLSNVGDIAARTGLSKSEVSTVIGHLEGDQIHRVYEGDGLPTIFVTKQMLNSLTSEVGEPEWLEEYEFEEKKELRDDVKEANSKISEYQILERLLYGTGDPLEDSVEHGFEKLDLDYEATEEDEDFLIEYDDQLYVLEVKGKSSQIDKGDIDQLGGWLRKKIDEGHLADDMTGVLLHNHQRDQPPSERDEPLTSKAEQFLTFHNSVEVSTQTLFEVLKDLLEDSVTKEEARERFIETIS